MAQEKEEQKQSLISNERTQNVQMSKQFNRQLSNRSLTMIDAYSSLTQQRQESLKFKKKELENQLYEEFMKKTQLTDNRGYDPSIKADLKFAQRHQQANKVKQINLMSSQSIDEENFCQCC